MWTSDAFTVNGNSITVDFDISDATVSKGGPAVVLSKTGHQCLNMGNRVNKSDRN